jgi:predicted RNase H-like HicB family nuclease
MELTVTVHQEHGGYWSEVAELPGCFASGGTLEELREALGEAVGLYVADVPGVLGREPLPVGESRVMVSVP